MCVRRREGAGGAREWNPNHGPRWWATVSEGGTDCQGDERGGALDLNPHPSPAQNVQNVSHLHPEPMPLNPGHPGRSGGGCANEMNFP